MKCFFVELLQLCGFIFAAFFVTTISIGIALIILVEIIKVLL